MFRELIKPSGHTPDKEILEAGAAAVIAASQTDEPEKKSKEEN